MIFNINWLTSIKKYLLQLILSSLKVLICNALRWWKQSNHSLQWPWRASWDQGWGSRILGAASSRKGGRADLAELFFWEGRYQRLVSLFTVSPKQASFTIVILENLPQISPGYYPIIFSRRRRSTGAAWTLTGAVRECHKWRGKTNNQICCMYYLRQNSFKS